MNIPSSQAKEEQLTSKIFVTTSSVRPCKTLTAQCAPCKCCSGSKQNIRRRTTVKRKLPTATTNSMPHLWIATISTIKATETRGEKNGLSNQAPSLQLTSKLAGSRFKTSNALNQERKISSTNGRTAATKRSSLPRKRCYSTNSANLNTTVDTSIQS